MFEWFYDQHGVAMKEEIIENSAKILDNWAPNEGMKKLIKRFNKGVTYTSFAGQELAKHTIVTDFLTVTKKTRNGFLENGAPEVTSLQSHSIPIPIWRQPSQKPR